jgi:Flp pilus assembly protein TadG
MILRAGLKQDRPGNVICLVALMLTLLLGMAGYAIDGGMILTQKRTVQATADACAMAGACYFYQNYQTYYGSNVATYQTTAAGKAAQIAVANGFLSSSTTGTGGGNGSSVIFQQGTTNAGDCTVTCNFPPNITNNSIYNGTGASPSYNMNLNDGVIEVVIDYYCASYFTKVWGYNNVHVMCRAVARGNWVSPGMGVILLNYTAPESLADVGGGSGGGISVVNGNFVVNSNAPNAVYDTGSHVTIQAPEFDITGGTSVTPGSLQNNSGQAGTVLTGLHPTPDPFAYLQPYATATFNALPTLGASDVTGSGTAADPIILKAGNTYTSLPSLAGNYVQIQGTGMLGIDIGNGNAKAYQVDLTGSTISSNGAMIYLNSGTLSAKGSGTAWAGSFDSSGALSATPFTGITSGPLKGFAFWQPPGNANGITFQGNGSMNLSGTVYAPNSIIVVGGNGSTDQIASQMVAASMQGNGNGNVKINYNGPPAAKTRVLALIE